MLPPDPSQALTRRITATTVILGVVWTWRVRSVIEEEWTPSFWWGS
jgi:hypothetical protein